MLPKHATDEPADYFGPHALEAVAHGGTQWTIDGRIREFRRCDRPWVYVPFDSDHGRTMIRQLDVTMCERCGRSALTMTTALHNRARCHLCHWPMYPR